MTEPDPYAGKIKRRAIVWAEGVAALSVLTGMQVCLEALEAIKNSKEPLLQSVLFSGLVVHYARAFEGATHQETGIARAFSVKKLPPPFDKLIHAALLALRDDQIAHSGHHANDYSLTFLIAKHTVTTQLPDGQLTSEVKRHIIGTRARASFACRPSSMEVHGQLLAHIQTLHQAAAERLTKSIIEHDHASLFRLEQNAKEDWTHTKALSSLTVSVPPGSVVVLGEEDLALSLAKAPDHLPLSFAIVTLGVLIDEKGTRLSGSVATEDNQEGPKQPTS